MKRHNKEQRHQLAQESLSRGIETIAIQERVKLSTVRDWRREFNLSDQSTEGVDAASVVADSPRHEHALAKLHHGIVLSLASHPDIPSEIMDELVASSDFAIRKHLAGNPATDESVLRSLYRVNDPVVKCQLAGNPSTPVDLLEKLVKSKAYDVSAHLAANPAATADMLIELAKRTDYATSEAVANNPNTPDQVFMDWAKSNNSDDISFMLQNKNTIPQALWRITQKIDAYDTSRQQQLAEHPNLSAEALDYIATDTPSPEVVALIAAHPNTSQDTLRYIAYGREDTPRWWLEYQDMSS